MDTEVLVCCAKVCYVLPLISWLDAQRRWLDPSPAGRTPQPLSALRPHTIPPPPHIITDQDLSFLSSIKELDCAQKQVISGGVFSRFRPGSNRRQWPPAVGGKLQKLQEGCDAIRLSSSTGQLGPFSHGQIFFIHAAENHYNKKATSLLSSNLRNISCDRSSLTLSLSNDAPLLAEQAATVLNLHSLYGHSVTTVTINRNSVHIALKKCCTLTTHLLHKQIDKHMSEHAQSPPPPDLLVLFFTLHGIQIIIDFHIS